MNTARIEHILHGPARELEHENFLSYFMEAVYARPDNEAVVAGNNSISYRELDLQSDRLARHLLDCGMEKNSFIGVSMGRRAEIVAAILAIWKAGCIYVPVDPDFPEDRVRFIVSHSKMSAVLRWGHGGNDFGSRVQHIDISSVCQDVGKDALPPLRPSATPRDVAYVFYTSGSTGSPKGVTIVHRSLCNLLMSAASVVSMIASDRMLALTNISFDISLLEILLPLSVGATCVIAEKRLLIDSARLSRDIQKNKITIMQATPITWKMLLDDGWKNETGIRIICGGENLQDDLFRKLLSVTTSAWHAYGPTETTIWSSMTKFNKSESVHISQPVWNTKFYLVPTEPPQPDEPQCYELLIGGEGVANGYLNDEELTRKTFITSSDDRKIYRTGDIVHYENSFLKFVGRKDSQIKINGYRVEPNEIEVTTRSIPLIHDAVAILDRTCNKLTLFIAGPLLTDGSYIRKHLEQKLPAYMLPSRYIFLKKVPLTHNKKVDRIRLQLFLNEEDSKPAIVEYSGDW